MDIAADMRVPIYAAAPGEVVYAGNQVSGYGNLVVLRHDASMTTFYGHNDSLKVKTGDKVSANQVIALLGSTGRSTGPHVHFELREKDKPLNPRERLPKSEF
jgi:murein DD-endopeptidase MepM/ murein hydrolase activator NlpD